MPDSYVPLDGRRQAVTVVFSALVLISIGATVSDILEIRLLDRLIAGENVADSDIANNDSRQGMIGIVQFAAYVAAAIVFIRWLYGAYKNVDVVNRPERRYGHGWAIGAWFVPILNLWRPKQIVNDVWRAGASGPEDAEPGWLPAIWWTLYLVSSWVGSIAIRAWINGDTPEKVREGSIAYAISDGIDIFGAILAILIVRKATDRLDGRAATLPPPEPEGPLEDWQAPERPAGLPA